MKVRQRSDQIRMGGGLLPWILDALNLKVHKIENLFDSDFGICVISLIVMSKY
jgi:hypothetical protein